MGTAQDVFKVLLRQQIVPVLRDAGYQGSGQSFHRRYGGNWAVLDFQRSQWDWGERVSFTVNLGTASTRVLDALGERSDRPPHTYVCHWEDRLGHLLAGTDVWWEIRAEPDPDPAALDAVAAEVRDGLVDVALPALLTHSSDEAILEYALSPGGRGYRPLDVAGVLLAHLGGTADQRQAFTKRIDSARHYRLNFEADFRPFPGRPRVAANLALLGDQRPERRAQAALLLGRTQRTPQVVDALRATLGDPDSMVRTSAATSLADLGDVASLDTLLDTLRDDPSPDWAVNLGMALSKLSEREPEVRARVVPALRARFDKAIGSDLAGFGAALERLGESLPD